MKYFVRYNKWVQVTDNERVLRTTTVFINVDDIEVWWNTFSDEYPQVDLLIDITPLPKESL